MQVRRGGGHYHYAGDGEEKSGAKRGGEKGRHKRRLIPEGRGAEPPPHRELRGRVVPNGRRRQGRAHTQGGPRHVRRKEQDKERSSRGLKKKRSIRRRFQSG